MNVVVLAGGISTERDVSLVSGKMIYNALKKNGNFDKIYPAKKCKNSITLL